MATLRINGITLGCTPADTFSVLVEYKNVLDPTYTVRGTFAMNPDGTFVTPVDITGLTISSCYDIRITPDLPYICEPLIVQSCTQPQFEWIADEQVCETEGGFGIIKTIVGLSSPLKVWYDTVNQLVYTADGDSPTGNVYWFDPVTATTEADVTYSTTIQDDELYNAHIDDLNRRIYFVGRNTGGLLVYDIDTDTTSVVAYGTNGAFSRITLLVTATRIYAGDGIGGNIIIIDSASLTLLSTVPFTGNVQLIEVGTNLYAVNTNNGLPDIRVYNSALTLIDTIIVPGAAPWTGGNYWQSGFYDPTSTNFYFSDTGSNQRFVIETVGRTIIDTQVNNNRSGKTNVIHSWTINPITNDLFCLFSAQDSSSDSSPVQRMYLEERGTFQYLNMLENQYISGMSHIFGTDQVMGTVANRVFWVMPNAGYGTDGAITIISNTVGSDNTGNLLTLTLQEVSQVGQVPTGNTKPNLPSDPDYIAPVQDMDTCPISVDLACPVDAVTTYDGAGTVYYEFAIPSTVRFNPAVDNIAIYAYDTVLLSRDGVPVVIADPTLTNFYDGSFTSLLGVDYSVEVVYRSAINTELASCIIAV